MYARQSILKSVCEILRAEPAQREIIALAERHDLKTLSHLAWQGQLLDLVGELDSFQLILDGTKLCLCQAQQVVIEQERGLRGITQKAQTVLEARSVPFDLSAR